MSFEFIISARPRLYVHTQLWPETLSWCQKVGNPRELGGYQVMVPDRLSRGICASLALHHLFKPCFDRRPLALDNAVVDRMAIGPIGHNQLIAQHPLLDRSQALNSPL